jgi:hypothetical protein
MTADIESDSQASTYVVAATSLFPPGRITITLDASYDAFARHNGVGARRVRVTLPDGTAFETPAFIAIIDGSDTVSAQPKVMLCEPLQISPLPEGSSCTILPK